MAEIKKPPKPLNHPFCESVKGTDKLKKYADGHGLYFYVTPEGGKSWRFYYRFEGKQKSLSFGTFRYVSLSEARKRQAEAKDLLYKGIDPILHNRTQKENRTKSLVNTFEAVAREWHDKKKETLTPTYAQNRMRVFENNVFPVLGDRPVTSITPKDIRNLLETIEDRGAYTISHRALCLIRKVFSHAMSHEKCERDPTRSLQASEVLKSRTVQHQKAIDMDELPEFLGRLKQHEAEFSVFARCAVRLLMLTFVRTSELLKAQWKEIDLEAKQWVIRSGRMKMKRDHIVPLSDQALLLFKELFALRKKGSPYVFHIQRTKSKNPHICVSTVRLALGKMGYAGHMTGHGFRRLAMGCLVEKLGYDPELVHLQLSHSRQGLSGIYNPSKFIPTRTEMMQAWADYIDGLTE